MKMMCFPSELLQLVHQPHLDFQERFQLLNGNKDDDSFPATTNFSFLGSRYISAPRWALSSSSSPVQRGPGRCPVLQLLYVGLHDLALEMNMACTWQMWPTLVAATDTSRPRKSSSGFLKDKIYFVTRSIFQLLKYAYKYGRIFNG